jgi:hypothetical protein
MSPPPPPPPAIRRTSAVSVLAGVTELLAELVADVPLAFVAVIVKVYAVPFVKPETVIGDVPVAVNAPGLDVARYSVTVDPPVAPAVYDTAALASPEATDTIVGACGAVVAVTPVEAELAEDVAYPFDAVTV